MLRAEDLKISDIPKENIIEEDDTDGLSEEDVMKILDLNLSTHPYEGAAAISILGLQDLYFTPKLFKGDGFIPDLIGRPDNLEMMEMYFIQDENKNVYGYYSGLHFLNATGGTDQHYVVWDVNSAKVNEHKNYVVGSIEWRIHPLEVKINKENKEYFSILDTLNQYMDYLEMEPEEYFEMINDRVQLDGNIFKNILQEYPNRYNNRVKEVIKHVFA